MPPWPRLRRRLRPPRPRKSHQVRHREDFTKIYTFVTAEYSQGQRDYFTLVNGRGGVNGYTIDAEVGDHANELPRGIEAYERLKREGMVLIDPLSTPVARALVSRALEDKINLVTAFSGRSDAADGAVFPYVLPLSPNYWTQAGLIVDFFRQQDKDLKGKKIVLVHIDTPFGGADPDLPGARPEARLQLRDFPVHAARQRSVRDLAAGAPRQAGLGGVLGRRRRSDPALEAIRNGIPMDHLVSRWISESDMDVAGKDAVKGVLGSSRAPVATRPIRHRPSSDRQGMGAGPAKDGAPYYNYGVHDVRSWPKASASRSERKPTADAGRAQ